MSATDAFPAAKSGGPQDDRRNHHGPRRAAGVNADAALAAGLVVVLCVVARVPDRILEVSGLHGWAPALVGVLAAVNGARVIAQTPFTFARRTTSAARWAADQVKVLGAAVVVGAALTIPLYALMRATAWWWLWAGILFATVTVAAQAAMPVLLRLQTGPLSPVDPLLARQVSVVAARAGVDVSGGILLAEPAKGNRPRCNAYVVGSGPTRRVVLESGIAAWPAALVDQVVAHEIGHWRLHHTTRRLPVTLLAQLATLALAAAVLSSHSLLAWAGVTHAGDPRSYPLVLALTTILVLPARLMLAAYDRGQERQADRFALTLLRDADHFAAMLDRAATEGDAPRQLPWWRYCTASHPPIAERILACQRFASAA